MHAACLTCGAPCSDLAGRQLSGQLPLDQRVWGALPAVTSVNLNNNTIQGYVPPQLDQLGQVQNLNLGNNGLQGPLPTLSNLSSVENVTFSNNQLTGISCSSRALHNITIQSRTPDMLMSYLGLTV